MFAKVPGPVLLQLHTLTAGGQSRRHIWSLLIFHKLWLLTSFLFMECCDIIAESCVSPDFFKEVAFCLTPVTLSQPA